MRIQPILTLLCLGLSAPLHRAQFASTPVEIIYNPGQTAEPFVVRWAATPGKSYDILAAEDLEQSWTVLNPEPIVADAPSARWIDPTVLTRRFYQVRERADDPGNGLGGEVVYGQIFPERANLAPGASQQFRSSLPSGGGVTWSVAALDGGEAGVITSGGRYTAPARLPDPPLMVVRARNATNATESAMALVTILGPDQVFITRDQAIELVIEQVIPALPEPGQVVGFAAQEPLTAADRLVPARPMDSGSVVPSGNAFGAVAAGTSIGGPSWFFMIDLFPGRAWAHFVRYVLVDARTGTILSNQLEEWYPMINGDVRWARFSDRLGHRDRFYAGAQFAADVERANPPAARLAAAPVQETLQWAGIAVPDSAAACPCPDGPRRYAVVLADDSTASVDGIAGLAMAGANLLFTIFDQDAEDRIANGGTLMAETLEAAGFEVSRLIGKRKGGAAYLQQEFKRLRPIVRPCDVLLVYITAHGNKESVGNLNYGALSFMLEWIYTDAKYVVIDSCYSGNVIPTLNAERLQAHVMTSANTDEMANVLFYTSRFDTEKNREPLAFSNALLKCARSSPDFQALFQCTVATESNVSGPGPQLEMIGAQNDPDHDGVPTVIELQIGLNPNDPDSDQDGVCDGVELSRIRALPRRLDYKSPQVVQERLANATRLVSYETVLKLAAPGTPFDDTIPSETNPFGFGPLTGWTVVDGRLPSGFVMDRATGRINGTTGEVGAFAFRVGFVDGLGVRTEQALELHVLPPAVDVPPVVQVSTSVDGNVRDDDISFREAILLVTGKLSTGDLRPDPNPNDGVAEGELRWLNEGAPGADSRDRIEFAILGGGVNVTQGPLLLDGSGDTIKFWPSLALRAAEGPILVVSGTGNQLFNGGDFIVESGPALEFSGRNNVFGGAFSMDRPAPTAIEGGSIGSGIVVSGQNNWIGGALIRNFERGVEIKEGATANTLVRLRLVENRHGALLHEGAAGNTLWDCVVGFVLDAVAAPTPRPNLSHGIVVEGGAHDNRIEKIDVGGNGGSGIMIRGTGTSGNLVLNCRVGSSQGFTSRPGPAGPNQQHGIVISSGATRNRVAGGEITENMGHGVLMTDPGTSENEIGSFDPDGLEIVKPDATGDGVRIDGAATGNLISIEVIECGGDGVAILGPGTDGNRVGRRVFEDLTFPTIIERAAGAGIRIGGGAKANQIEGARILRCGTGVIIEGEGTEENVMVDTRVTQNSGDGIVLQGGCRGNRLESNRPIEENQGSGLVIAGAGTQGNIADGCQLGGFQPNGRFGIEIHSGAAQNLIFACEIRRHNEGAIRVAGDGTVENWIHSCSIKGGLFEEDIVASGLGILIADGASANRIVGNNLSQNGGDGIRLTGATTAGNHMFGNRLFDNRGYGILIDHAAENRVGSPVGDGNTLTSCREPAIRITGPTAAGNQITGNVIGSWSEFFRNHSHGVLIDGGAHGNVVGGIRLREPAPQVPMILLPPTEANRGGGNVITGNQGDGIRIDGAAENEVAGNLIGFSDNDRAQPGNGGHGIALINGGRDNRVGDCRSTGDTNPGYSNRIVNNAGAGILVSGSASVGNSIRRNSIHDNAAGQIVLEDGGNRNQPGPGGVVEIAEARITGTAPGPGYVELFSTFPDDPGVFHLTAYVMTGGDFVINQLHPDQSDNAVILESRRPIRIGTQQLSFTSSQAGDTSEFVEQE